MEKTSIYAKLLEFQKLGVSIKKNSTNPHFKNKYANIDEVLEKVKPALSSVGITMMQLPTETGLKTVLWDAGSDTGIEGFLPFLGATKPQEIGSNLTYLRRYSLVAMLGLEDEDDDGEAASAPKPVAKAAPSMSAEIALQKLAAAANLAELQSTWKAIPSGLQKDPEVLAMKDQRKEELINSTN